MHPKLPLSQHYAHIGHAAGGTRRHLQNAQHRKHDHTRRAEAERALNPVIVAAGHARPQHGRMP